MIIGLRQCNLGVWSRGVSGGDLAFGEMRERVTVEQPASD